LNGGTRSNDDFDPGLEALFLKEHRQVPAEPFVGATLRRVASRRRLVRHFKRVLLAAVLIAVIVASPWLIEASVIVSAALDAAFAAVSSWLETPGGAGAAILVGVVLAVLFRLRVRS